MPKYSNEEINRLSLQAYKLLDEGLDKKTVAKKLGVSVRTIQRWTSQECYTQKNSARQLINMADETVIEKTDIEEQIKDLIDYQEAQRFLALEMGSLAGHLSLISKRLLKHLEEHPEEISIRLLPQLLRTMAELSEKSSNCWARATGLEEVLNVIEKMQFDE